MDRRVQEMVAIETPQVAHEIGKHPLTLLAGFAGADDEVGRRQVVVAFQNAKERARFGRKALARALSNIFRSLFPLRACNAA